MTTNFHSFEGEYNELPKSQKNTPKKLAHNEQPFNDWGDVNLDGDKKYEQLRRLYKLRLETVQESIKRSLEVIQTDKLVDTLKEEEIIAPIWL